MTKETERKLEELGKCKSWSPRYKQKHQDKLNFHQFIEKKAYTDITIENNLQIYVAEIHCSFSG